MEYAIDLVITHLIILTQHRRTRQSLQALQSSYIVKLMYTELDYMVITNHPCGDTKLSQLLLVAVGFWLIAELL